MRKYLLMQAQKRILMNRDELVSSVSVWYPIFEEKKNQQCAQRESEFSRLSVVVQGRGEEAGKV